MALLFPFLFSFSFQTTTIPVSERYSSFTLTEDTNLLLDIGSTNQAFIIGTSNFLSQSTIQITDNDLVQNLGRDQFGSARGISVVAPLAELQFTGSSPATVWIWIIDRSDCPHHSLVLEPSGDFHFDFIPNEAFAGVCIFLFRSTPKEVTFGFKSGIGNAFLSNSTTRNNCEKGVCKKRARGPVYAAYTGGEGGVQFDGFGAAASPTRVCELGFVTYVNATASEDRAIASASKMIRCNLRPGDERLNINAGGRPPPPPQSKAPAVSAVNLDSLRASERLTDNSALWIVGGVLLVIVAIIAFVLWSVWRTCGAEQPQVEIAPAYAPASKEKATPEPEEAPPKAEEEGGGVKKRPSGKAKARARAEAEKPKKGKDEKGKKKQDWTATREKPMKPKKGKW